MPRDEIPGLRAAQLRLGRLPGYVRRPDLARRSSADGHTYKKGWEVRFTARTEAEITEIRDLVMAAGFAPARPFFKGHQLIQPVYGIAAVQAYLAAREAFEELGRTRAAGSATEPATGRTPAAGGDGSAARPDGVPAAPAGAVPIPEQACREAAAPVAAAAAAAAAAGAAALAANTAGATGTAASVAAASAAAAQATVPGPAGAAPAGAGAVGAGAAVVGAVGVGAVGVGSAARERSGVPAAAGQRVGGGHGRRTAGAGVSAAGRTS
ncbi:hypothetical protein [Kitasatospora sp. NPDC085879]|uniref:hypothetical protein n=1 Tax=Kitasatospora sp. NPDC085879 TaxID=3154769 RepID=UPI003435B2D2